LVDAGLNCPQLDYAACRQIFFPLRNKYIANLGFTAASSFDCSPLRQADGGGATVHGLPPKSIDRSLHKQVHDIDGINANIVKPE
jgi:hypothetical protein